MNLIDLWGAIPLVIIAVGALAVLLLGVLAPGRATGPIAVLVLLAAALWAVPTPPAVSGRLGIAFTPFARFFTTLFSLTAVAALLLSGPYNRRRGILGEEYPATVLFAAFGMAALVAATNLLILFLALEALTFAFYILVAMDLKREESAEAGLKYLLQGAVAAACIAFGIALIYAAAGTIAIPAALQGSLHANPVAIAGWGFLLSGLAFKVSLVPAHLWTPDVYEGAPTPVVAFLSTGSKGATFAALIMLFTAAGGVPVLHHPLWCLSLLSMLVGNLAALVQTSLKRMLAYSSIAQMGYIVLALLTATREGYRAVVFYVVAYTLMNVAAFGVISSLGRSDGGETIRDLRGAGYAHPFRGAVLALAMFALAGIPPTAGFFGKFIIFFAALRGGEPALAVIGILTAAISVYFYLGVVVTLYLRPAEGPFPGHEPSLSEGLTLAACALLTLLLGIFPAPLLDLIDLIIP